MGRWIKNDWDGTCGVFIPEGVVVGKVAEPMGVRVTGRGGWVESQQVVEGEGIYKCEWGIPALALIQGVTAGMCETSGECSLC